MPVTTCGRPIKINLLKKDRENNAVLDMWSSLERRGRRMGIIDS